MLNGNEKKQLVERFIHSAMDDAELAEFTSALTHDKELRSLLDAESGTEALLLTVQKSPVSAIRYKQLANHALELLETPSVLYKTAWLRAYAVAATLIIMLMSGYLFLIGKDPGISSTNADHAGAGHFTSPSEKARAGKSIMRLTPHALLLAEEGTKSRIIRNGDSSVHVVLSQGNAYFDVANSEAQPIIVATPHTAITLNGSVTRIVVTELETEVSVFEGSAEVIHRYDTSMTRELLAGNSVFADFTTLQSAKTLAFGVCESRKSMFRAYVAWVQRQAHG